MLVEKNQDATSNSKEEEVYYYDKGESNWRRNTQDPTDGREASMLDNVSGILLWKWLFVLVH